MLRHGVSPALCVLTVQRVRAKIEDVPSRPTFIETVRGFGYRFATP
jgi:DNA-binding response OmpR family regulator